MHQLCIASADLKTVRKLLPPEVVTPDRPFRSGRATYVTPDSIAWSPDDRFIAFPRADWFTLGDQRFPGTALYACEVATGHITELAVHPDHNTKDLYFWFSPQWSADNKHFGYVGLGTHGETNLYMGNTPGADARSIEGRFDNYRMSDWPIWSPDGKYLAFREGILRAVSADPVETVHVMEPGGRFARTVFRSCDWTSSGTARTGSQSLNGCRLTGLAWSADGKSLALTTIDDATNVRGGKIWHVSLRGALHAKLIDRWDLPVFAPEWLGNHSSAVLQSSSEGFRLMRVEPASSTEIARLPSDDFDWSPDRKSIAVVDPGASADLKLQIVRIR